MDAFAGEIRAFPAAYLPEGWLACDGTAYPPVQYQKLFALIGNLYGGDGVSTFNVPDLRGGMVAIGAGTGPLATTKIGQKYVPTSTSVAVPAYLDLEIDNMPAHTHTGTFAVTGTSDPVPPQIAFVVSKDNASPAAPANGYVATAKPSLGTATSIYSTGAATGTTTLADVTATASGGSGGCITGGYVAVAQTGQSVPAQANVVLPIPPQAPPFVAMNYGICWDGDWPQRPD